MKQLTFPDTDEGRLMFRLGMVGAYNPRYQFQTSEELRNHGKLLDAIETISDKDENIEGARKLHAGEQRLVLDDAWLQLWIRMASPPNMNWAPGGDFGKTTRNVARFLDFLEAAPIYTSAPAYPVP